MKRKIPAFTLNDFHSYQIYLLNVNILNHSRFFLSTPIYHENKNSSGNLSNEMINTKNCMSKIKKQNNKK